jgi:hypothetical protein
VSVTIDKPVDLGPGQLDTGTDPFVLASADWLAIQRYVTAALALPVTDDAITSYFVLGTGDSPTNYQDILTAFQAMAAHCGTFKQSTFPASVALATDIVDYDRNVSVYYAALENLLPQLQAASPSDQVKQEFKAILDQRALEAAGYRDKATAVAKALGDFATETEQDGDTISTLVTSYNTKLGATSTDRQQLEQSIATWTDTLNQAQAQYDHDVIVSATTPAYAWVGLPFFPVGLIAAAIVAGIYGSAAVKAQNEIKAARGQIAALQQQVQRDITITASLKAAETAMGTIQASLKAALPIIQKIEGVWDALAGDLSNLGDLIVNDIENALPILMDLGIQAAMKQWDAVAAEANDYRVNAFITVSGSPTD